jgi:hemoglobin
MSDPAAQPSVYELLGDEPFWRLARAFYARVAADPDPGFRGMFPADLAEPIRNQAEFLIQYFGGPATYSSRKGHPRLRLRHAPFPIDFAARNRWVGHMRGALEDAAIPEPVRGAMLIYFERTATFLMNRPD